MDSVGHVDEKTNHRIPQCFRRQEGHFTSATSADTKNGSDRNKWWNWWSGGYELDKVNENKEKFMLQKMRLPLVILEN